MFMRVLCMGFLLGPWFVTMDRCLGLNIKGRSGDKGEPLKYRRQGFGTPDSHRDSSRTQRRERAWESHNQR